MVKSTTKKDAVATTPKGGALAIPTYGKEIQHAGWDGASTADYQIPFLNQLQALSPQCTEGEPAYRVDAKPGMLINSVTGDLYPGDVELVFALTKHSYVEWKDQASGGGFVAEHAIDSDVVKKAKAAAKDQLNLKSEAGNDIVETFNAYALIVEDGQAKDQVVVSFNRTKIKRYKQIMTRLRTFKGSDRIPLFAHRLVMSATNEKNAANQPYKNVQVNPAVNNDIAASLLPGDSPILEVANALREAIMGGTARANFDSAKTGAATRGDDKGADEVFG